MLCECHLGEQGRSCASHRRDSGALQAGDLGRHFATPPRGANHNLPCGGARQHQPLVGLVCRPPCGVHWRPEPSCSGSGKRGRYIPALEMRLVSVFGMFGGTNAGYGSLNPVSVCTAQPGVLHQAASLIIRGCPTREERLLLVSSARLRNVNR